MKDGIICGSRDTEMDDATDPSSSEDDGGSGGDCPLVVTDQPQSPHLRVHWLKLQIVELQRLHKHYQALQAKASATPATEAAPEPACCPDNVADGDNGATCAHVRKRLEMGDAVNGDALLSYSHDYTLRRLHLKKQHARERARATAAVRRRPGRRPASNKVPCSPLTETPLPFKRRKFGALGASTPGSHPHTPSRTPRRADFDIDDVVLPFAWQNKKATIETVKVKEISTPQCRRLSKPAGNAKASRRATLAESVEGKTGTDASSEEDTSDEAFMRRHKAPEEKEIRLRYPRADEKKRAAQQARIAEIGVGNFQGVIASIEIAEGTPKLGPKPFARTPSTLSDDAAMNRELSSTRESSRDTVEMCDADGGSKTPGETKDKATPTTDKTTRMAKMAKVSPFQPDPQASILNPITASSSSSLARAGL
eukprot:CAMPEP_0117017298 /NCGR_PEP_ID=MMETSP0472-20121206/13528_1 /TAXON_ID=693140 ORGANISM="Tiarina fusus, Strain LIS" /NCGR_SAMPLE_ID=MMETSP0472 /ASSEMBLY_ACC=CAM_ASM_000603 /LENGTH=424 /DNA_ID=CAMNT_0004721627 /DNA_START=137 /DNA_END=1415 /DNA_ORIENTATION=+